MSASINKSEKFVNKVYELVGDEYEILSSYVKSHQKIKMKHNKCRHEYDVTPAKFVSAGQRCPKCAGRRRTTDSYKKEVFELVGDEYVVLGEYTRADEKIKLFHQECLTDCDISPSMFLSGIRCKRCSHKNRGIKSRKTHMKFLEEMKHVLTDEYEVLSEYLGMHNKILIKHRQCETSYYTTPSSISKGSGCLKCSQKEQGVNSRKSHESFVDEFMELVGDEYSVIGIYEKQERKIELKHNVCGNTFYGTPKSLLRKDSRRGRCTVCSLSEGESKIHQLLSNFEINFRTEKTFLKCLSSTKKKMRFDFEVNRNVLVEFDGGQHFFSVDFAGKGEEWAIKELCKTQNNDRIKNQYCIDNNVPLVRIPYWEFSNIEAILENTLIHFGLIESNPNYDNSKVLEYLVDENWNHDEYLAKCPKNIKEQQKSDSIAI